MRVGAPPEATAARRLGEHVPVAVRHVTHHACSRVVEELPSSRVGAPEEQARHPVGMARRVRDRRHAGVHPADEGESVEGEGISDRFEIADHRVERVRVDLAGREAGAAGVEADELMSRGEALVPRANRSNPPFHLAMGRRMTCIDDGVALTDRPERDADTIARPTVADPRLGHWVARPARIGGGPGPWRPTPRSRSARRWTSRSGHWPRARRPGGSSPAGRRGRSSGSRRVRRRTSRS